MGASSVATATALVQLAPEAPGIALLLSAVKDVVVTVAAALGAYVAWRGLHAWRDQLSGQTEYDLAKRLLRQFYRYRDAVAGVRRRFMTMGEMLADGEVAPQGFLSPEWRYSGTTRAYRKRWEEVLTARADLYPELLEAEAVWGDDITRLATPLFVLENELLMAVEDALMLLDPDASPDERTHLEVPEESKKRRRILYARPGHDDDVFGASFQSGLDAIAERLTPHLRRRA